MAKKLANVSQLVDLKSVNLKILPFEYFSKLIIVNFKKHREPLGNLSKEA
jgi:hypothetical protein